MDLRRYNLTKQQIKAAAAVLNYQPFVLSDDVQTGAAYSWVYGGDPRTKPTLVFQRAYYSTEEWTRITDTNARLRAMYEDLLDEVARRIPGGTLLDVACNNGYFPVGSELRGMRATGMDLGDYGPSIATLNEILGTTARFRHQAYDPVSHTLPIHEQFDVVVASAIMCHLPDPLYFLAALGKVAKRAILFWGQMVDTEAFLIAYTHPHPELSKLTEFPHQFNDNTRVSRGLFIHAMNSMGFREVVALSWRKTWLTTIHEYRSPSLEHEIQNGGAHFAYLALR